MKRLPKLLEILLLCCSLYACGTLTHRDCETLADVLHDVSFYLCTAGTTTPGSQHTATKPLISLVDQYTAALAALPTTPDRDALLTRLAIQRANLTHR